MSKPTKKELQEEISRLVEELDATHAHADRILERCDKISDAYNQLLKERDEAEKIATYKEIIGESREIGYTAQIQFLAIALQEALGIDVELEVEE